MMIGRYHNFSQLKYLILNYEESRNYCNKDQSKYLKIIIYGFLSNPTPSIYYFTIKNTNNVNFKIDSNKEFITYNNIIINNDNIIDYGYDNIKSLLEHEKIFWNNFNGQLIEIGEKIII